MPVKPVYHNERLNAENLKRVNAVDVGLHDIWFLIVERVGEMTTLSLSRKARYLYEDEDARLSVIILSVITGHTFRAFHPKFIPPTVVWYFRDDMPETVREWIISLDPREHEPSPDH